MDDDTCWLCGDTPCEWTQWGNEMKEFGIECKDSESAPNSVHFRWFFHFGRFHDVSFVDESWIEVMMDTSIDLTIVEEVNTRRTFPVVFAILIDGFVLLAKGGM